MGTECYSPLLLEESYISQKRRHLPPAGKQALGRFIIFRSAFAVKRQPGAEV